MKSDKHKKEMSRRYYSAYLLQFLGLEKDVYLNSNGSYTFYDFKYGKMILWITANKIQVAKDASWINDADKFIIQKVLSEKDVMSLLEYYQPRKINFNENC